MLPCFMHSQVLLCTSQYRCRINILREYTAAWKRKHILPLFMYQDFPSLSSSINYKNLINCKPN